MASPTRALSGPRGLRPSATFFVLLAASLLAACTPNGRRVFVDPPVDATRREVYTPTGDPEVDVGFYEEQLYEPLKDGSPCPVVHGAQGGRWTMPAIRIRGIAAEVHVAVAIVTEGGEDVGSADLDTTFVLATDGWLEVQALPVRVRHAPPRQFAPIDDLYGQEATLTVTVSDRADRSATRQVRVVLTKG